MTTPPPQSPSSGSKYLNDIKGLFSTHSLVQAVTVGAVSTLAQDGFAIPAIATVAQQALFVGGASVLGSAAGNVIMPYFKMQDDSGVGSALVDAGATVGILMVFGVMPTAVNANTLMAAGVIAGGIYGSNYLYQMWESKASSPSKKGPSSMYY